MSARYALTFFFEWGGPCLWSKNQSAHDRFNTDVDLDDLPLSAETRERAKALTVWHDGALDWENPLAPGPWRQDECDRFNNAADELLGAIRSELGADFEVVDRRDRRTEDPQLEEYLRAPESFWNNRAASFPRRSDWGICLLILIVLGALLVANLFVHSHF